MGAFDWLEVPPGTEEMRTWQISMRVVRSLLFRLCMMRMLRLRLFRCAADVVSFSSSCGVSIHGTAAFLLRGFIMYVRLVLSLQGI